jgi:hypothetical protein
MSQSGQKQSFRMVGVLQIISIPKGPALLSFQ